MSKKRWKCEGRHARGAGEIFWGENGWCEWDKWLPKVQHYKKACEALSPVFKFLHFLLFTKKSIYAAKQSDSLGCYFLPKKKEKYMTYSCNLVFGVDKTTEHRCFKLKSWQSTIVELIT